MTTRFYFPFSVKGKIGGEKWRDFPFDRWVGNRQVSHQRINQLQNPEQVAARKAVARALRSGRLIRALACENCGATAHTHAHHAAGYERENWLKVAWLCCACHHAEHKRLRGQRVTP